MKHTVFIKIIACALVCSLLETSVVSAAPPVERRHDKLSPQSESQKDRFRAVRAVMRMFSDENTQESAQPAVSVPRPAAAVAAIRKSLGAAWPVLLTLALLNASPLRAGDTDMVDLTFGGKVSSIEVITLGSILLGTVVVLLYLISGFYYEQKTEEAQQERRLFFRRIAESFREHKFIRYVRTHWFVDFIRNHWLTELMWTRFAQRKQAAIEEEKRIAELVKQREEEIFKREYHASIFRKKGGMRFDDEPFVPDFIEEIDEMAASRKELEENTRPFDLLIAVRRAADTLEIEGAGLPIDRLVFTEQPRSIMNRHPRKGTIYIPISAVLFPDYVQHVVTPGEIYRSRIDSGDPLSRETLILSLIVLRLITLQKAVKNKIEAPEKRIKDESPIEKFNTMLKDLKDAELTIEGEQVVSFIYDQVDQLVSKFKEKQEQSRLQTGRELPEPTEDDLLIMIVPLAYNLLSGRRAEYGIPERTPGEPAGSAIAVFENVQKLYINYAAQLPMRHQRLYVSFLPFLALLDFYGFAAHSAEVKLAADFLLIGALIYGSEWRAVLDRLYRPITSAAGRMLENLPAVVKGPQTVPQAPASTATLSACAVFIAVPDAATQPVLAREARGLQEAIRTKTRIKEMLARYMAAAEAQGAEADPAVRQNILFGCGALSLIDAEGAEKLFRRAEKTFDIRLPAGRTAPEERDRAERAVEQAA